LSRTPSGNNLSGGQRNAQWVDKVRVDAESVGEWAYGARWEVTMDDHEPTIRSRELGEGLRRAMQYAGLNGQQVARQLDLSPSWVSRVVSGKRNATAVQVSAFLAVCRVTGEERERLLELCADQHTLGWFQQHGSRLPQQVVTLIDQGDRDQQLPVDAGARPAADR
jgi:transcriptional regulator with XRE-family HTH domain